MPIRIASAILMFLALLVCGGNGFAADPAPMDPENTLYLDLDYGRVVIRMRPDLAPKHVERIKHLVRAGFYDGMVFHRVIDGFMAQTGDPLGNGSGGSGRSVAAEFTRTPQVRGTVSMARAAGKDSADSQWFIVLADSREALDGKYTVWGQVTSGMDFVDMIHKGDASRNGTVKNPDHLVRLQIAADADRALAANDASVNLVQNPDAAAEARNFSAAEFRCLALNNRPGSALQSAVARVWTHGYLAGFYKAQNKLTLSSDAASSFDGALLDVCKAYPEALLLSAAGQELAKTARELPAATGAFSAVSYVCKDYTNARGGADTAQADFADLWAFAFIQGYKNVSQPNMEIPFGARPQLLAAIAGGCARNADMGFADLTALLAGKVKLK